MRLVLSLALAFSIMASGFSAAAMEPPARTPSLPPPPAEEILPDGTAEPVVTLKAPPSYTARRIALFPLELPGYILKGALWPVGAGLEWSRQRHLGERIEDTLSFKSNEIWIYPVMDKSPGESFGGGVAVKGIDLFSKGYFFDADYRVHVNLDMFVDLSFKKRELFSVGSLPVDLIVDGGWSQQNSFAYYGVGNDSSSGNGNPANWKEQDLNANIKLALKPIQTLGIYALVGGSATSTGEATNNGIDPANNPPLGYGRWLPYVRAGGGVEHNTLDIQWGPRRGGVQRLEASRFQYLGSGGSFSYNDIRLTLEHYFPLWSPEHTLMLRNAWWVQPSGKEMPVPRMTTLDADHMLRGFDAHRFRDRSSVVFNGEYYFPLYPGLRGMILGDYGRVFNGITNLEFTDFKYSAGGGVDFNLSRVVVLRIRAAYGGEGVKFLLTLLKRQI